MSDKNEFKVGDTVRLNSGGPLMTISALGSSGTNGKVSVTWFDGKKKQEDLFEPETLTHDDGGPVFG